MIAEHKAASASRGYWIKVEDKAARGVVMRFRKLATAIDNA